VKFTIGVALRVIGKKSFQPNKEEKGKMGCCFPTLISKHPKAQNYEEILHAN
jgi:hypothetical protein